MTGIINDQTDSIEHEFPFEQEDQYATVKIHKRLYSDGSTRCSVVLLLDLLHPFDSPDLMLYPDKARELAGLLLMAADEAQRVDSHNNEIIKSLLGQHV